MKQLVIVGASGMVGGHALRYALAHPGVERVTSVGRRDLGISHPKLEQVLHLDFSDCSALAKTLTGQDAAVFCLGAYTGVVSDEELRKTSLDYPVEFARVLRDASPDAKFAFLSGMGADPTGQSRASFARYKGAAEKALQSLGLGSLYIFRPAYIHPVEPRPEPNVGYRLLRVAYPAFRRFFPGSVIESDDLARAMVDVCLRNTSEHESVVFENREIQALAAVRTGMG